VRPTPMAQRGLPIPALVACVAVALAFSPWAVLSGDDRAAGPATDPRHGRAVELALRLLPAIYPNEMRELTIRSVQPGSWERDRMVFAHWLGDDGHEHLAGALVDLAAEEITLFSGALLALVTEDTAEERLKAAEGFARAHLGPFTESTHLVGSVQTGDHSLHLTWANVLPSGAWTGDWWSVTVSDRDGRCGVTSFSRRRAVRYATEDEVRVAESGAISVAREVLAKMTATQSGELLQIEQTRLVLSYFLSPSGGPVWFVTLRSATPGSRHELIIDAVSGKWLKDRSSGSFEPVS